MRGAGRRILLSGAESSLLCETSLCSGFLGPFLPDPGCRQERLLPRAAFPSAQRGLPASLPPWVYTTWYTTRVYHPGYTPLGTPTQGGIYTTGYTHPGRHIPREAPRSQGGPGQDTFEGWPALEGYWAGCAQKWYIPGYMPPVYPGMYHPGIHHPVHPGTPTMVHRPRHPRVHRHPRGVRAAWEPWALL